MKVVPVFHEDDCVPPHGGRYSAQTSAKRGILIAQRRKLWVCEKNELSAEGAAFCWEISPVA